MPHQAALRVFAACKQPRALHFSPLFLFFHHQFCMLFILKHNMVLKIRYDYFL